MTSGNSKRPKHHGEGTLVLVIVLAGLCLLTSLYLNHLHYKVHTDSSFSSVCALSEEVNCETVALSPYSVFLGIPVSYWGVCVAVLYLVTAGLCLLDTRRKRAGGARGWGILWTMGGIGVAISALLFYIAHFLIESVCPFCMAIYLLNVAIAVTLTVHLVKQKIGLFGALTSDARGLLFKPALAVFALPVVMVAGGYSTYPKIYDTTACPTGEADEGLCSEPATYGKPDAPIRIVEYSDYECPFCSMTHFALRKAVDTYPDDVVLVHVQFPLDISCNDLLSRPFHEHACEAARASICAERQARFWDVNDWLYTHQKQIGRKDWGAVAEQIGLDATAFLACMDDPASLETVKANIEQAKETTFVKQGNVGTPIIYINDKGHLGGIKWEELQRYLVTNHGLPETP